MNVSQENGDESFDLVFDETPRSPVRGGMEGGSESLHEKGWGNLRCYMQMYGILEMWRVWSLFNFGMKVSGLTFWCQVRVFSGF
jgi:hypothetical protein